MTTSAAEDLPAWAEPFHSGGPGPAPFLPLDAPVTPAWAYGDGSGHGVRVAVIDSGVDGSHPLVGGVSSSVAITLDEAAENGVRIVDGEHEDLYGHGTACAAVIRSLAPGVELVSVRVLGANLRGSALAFAHGLKWCLAHDIVVANLSLSTTNERWFDVFHDSSRPRRQARACCWSPRWPTSVNGPFPASSPGSSRWPAVPARTGSRSGATRQGPADWGACGIDVEVAWGAHSTILASGNSFAAPVVAGHLARIASAHPGITPCRRGPCSPNSQSIRPACAGSRRSSRADDAENVRTCRMTNAAP